MWVLDQKLDQPMDEEAGDGILTLAISVLSAVGGIKGLKAATKKQKYEGMFAQKTLEIIDDLLSTYKNQGGYDLLGRTKDQIRTTEQVKAALKACTDLKLDGLVIIGGVTSNTDAAQLAETFAEAVDKFGKSSLFGKSACYCC